MQLLNPLSSGGWACALRRVLSWPVLLPLLIALVLLAAPGARAQDPATAAVVLVMVEDPGCPYCARWTAEIEPGYVRSAEGRFAQLVRRLSRIEGQVLWQDKPATGRDVTLSVHRDEYGYPGMVASYGRTRTDAEGRFVFDRVLPGLTRPR